ncbi:YbaK/EbsC family protein [Zhengella sp. ZM62]|uniref:YbaK/EbsC family protein n=1 Tax=Zhengella sedimenti TaxID=3390035 RepID=UPI003976F443
MSKSIARVEAAASSAGMDITVRRMGESTRTAAEAAQQCGCDVAQIVKSLIFQGQESQRLYLFLVAGDNSLDLAKAAALAGESLGRADPRLIREQTGFAIGGVSPIGHKIEIPCFADETLRRFETVWAAAGAHDAVFEAQTGALLEAAHAVVADLKG